MQAFFWISIFLLFYTYIGYGLLLLSCNLFFKRKKIVDEDLLPAVTFIVPAYNEEEIIKAKIENSLALIYPEHKIFFVFITDGSTDKTPGIISLYPRIKLLHEETRAGKSAAINRAMETVETPVVIFSDANILLHPASVVKIVRHYADNSVGGVSGEKRIADKIASPVGFGERLYWRYESSLKKANADFYTIVGAAGELFSIRRKLFKPLDPAIILDDFVISANVCKQGYRFLYEGEAYGTETSSASISEERKRKIRISAGCFQAFFLLMSLLNPFDNFKVTFQYISHRALRWTVCPLLLPLVFFTNLYLLQFYTSYVYRFTFATQCIFYFLAILGWLLSGRKTIISFLLIPYYFIFMIVSQYTGFYRFLTKRQTVLWEKVGRKLFV